tara:strand:+ start:379 stop:1272 length:894 start_codon:yes stop_codon:yes gene_type:complete
MAYLGKYETRVADFKVYTSSTATATHTLSWTPTSKQSLRITINGVVQQDDAFSLTGNTVTLDAAILVTDVLEIVGVNELGGQVLVPADGSIQTGKLGDDSVTLAKMAGGTDGNLITYDASGDPAHVATGTATHVLTSNGAGAAPTFQAAAAVPDATPRWLAYIGSDQSLSSNTTITYDYDTEVFDSDSAFDTSTNTFTVPVGEAGVYFCFAYSYHAGSNSDAHQLANIQINMGSSSFFSEIDSNSSFGKAYSVGVNGFAVLAEGDTVYVRGKSIFSAGTVVLQAALIRSAFGGWRIA